MKVVPKPDAPPADADHQKLDMEHVRQYLDALITAEAKRDKARDAAREAKAAARRAVAELDRCEDNVSLARATCLRALRRVTGEGGQQ